MNEIWKSVVGYEGLYEVSNIGRIKSLFDGRHSVCREKILTPYLTKDGYLCIDLSKNKNRVHKRVHRLVAEAFIPNPENKSQVDHINKIRSDNRVENLQWLTNLENQQKSWTQGRMVSEKTKLAIKETTQIISTWTNETLNLQFIGNPRDLVKNFPELKLSRGHLNEVKTGKRKQHKGWIVNAT